MANGNMGRGHTGHGWVGAGAAALAAAALLGVSLIGVAQAEPAPREGFFIGGGYSATQGNFDLESDDDSGDWGSGFGLDLGYAWPGGFGLGGGFAYDAFTYKIDTPLIDGDLTLGLFAADLSAFYFLPLSADFELTARAGLSSTQATITLGDVEADDSSAGVHLGVGGDFFFGGSVALMFEVMYRTYGVAFAQTKDEEVSSFGIRLGLRYR